MNTRNTSYPWYSEIPGETPLEQGDLIVKCQIVEPSTEIQETDQDLKADIAEYDVVVMSQSCDLQAGKINLVLVCPFYSLTEISTCYPTYKSPEMKEKLRRGNIVGYHLLD